MRLWDKGESTDELVFTFCVGEDYILDNRLVPYDVQASQAHVRMLAAQGYLAPADAGLLGACGCRSALWEPGRTWGSPCAG